MAPVTQQDLETHKQLVDAFFEAFNAHDWTALAALCHEDFHWVLVANDQHQSTQLAQAPPMGRRSDTSEMLAIYEQTIQYCADGVFELGYSTMTAEQDRVSVEAFSRATSSITGRRYTNLYHHLFLFRDGKILEMREYGDTFHAYDVWMAP